MGTNTIQIHKVDTNVGTAICCAPSTIAPSTVFPCSKFQLIFSMVTVALSTKTPTDNAKPPNVMILIVSPNAENNTMEANIDNGIEITTMIVLRMLPTNNKMTIPVNNVAIKLSCNTPSTAACTKSDWSPTKLSFKLDGKVSIMCGNKALICWIIVSVDEEPVFSTGNNTARVPFTLIILVCGGDPSLT